MDQLQSDIQTIATNLQDLSNATAFLENVMLNHAAVLEDLSNARDGFTKADYKTVGSALGDFSRLVLLHV